MAASAPGSIAAVRRFNRFYTRQIGVLRKGYLDSPFSLPEARVLYELFRKPAATASAIAAALDLDPGYLSRLLRQFEKRGLIARTASARDARQSHLALTARGRQAFAPLERSSNAQVGAMLDALDPSAQRRLISAMGTIETLLGGGEPEQKRAYSLRATRPGDFGWIVARHAELYAREYKWGDDFEGLCAQIVADFVNNYDPKYERCWIAEMDGENVGCVMLVKDRPGGKRPQEKPEVARLRLLLVDPKARGLGLGARLTGECVRFARRAGYKKITLWTHSVLTAARHIYENAGFTLTGSEKRRSWGRNVVAEFWDLKL